MKVLIVASTNSGRLGSFVEEQIKSLRALRVDADYFGVRGHGVRGYLGNLPRLKRKIRAYKPDIVHAHYGLSGLLATLNAQVPTVITFHGSDVNRRRNWPLSYAAARRSSFNIFVHSTLAKELRAGRRHSIIPCGVDLETFYPIDKAKARHRLGLESDAYYGLFASRFDRPVKNYALAKEALELLEYDVRLLELDGMDREHVNLHMNAVDFLLLTSFSESAPLVVKEAMACNTPVVSTAVGDVPELLGNVNGCYVCGYDALDVADKVDHALCYRGKTNGRRKVAAYSLGQIAHNIYGVYEHVLSTHKDETSTML